jgi:penicillin-binding protein 2
MSERSNRRLALFAILITVLLVVLMGRAAVLSVRDGGQLASAAAQNDTRVHIQPAARGLILDQTGTPLVGNQGGVSIRITPDRLPEGAGNDRVLARVGDIVGESPRKLGQRLLACGSPGASLPPVCHLGNPGDPVDLPVPLDPRATQQIAEQPERFPGVSLVSVLQRTYPQESLRASHVLGYLGQATGTELADDADLPREGLIGRTGLEKQYESVLRGKSGWQRANVNVAGVVTGYENVEAAETGDTLLTSLSAPVQVGVEESLRRVLGSLGQTGSAVVLDAKTGRVLGLGSYPDYDPNLWTEGISSAQYDELVASGALLNQAIQSISAPGSTWKAISVLAMQKEGMLLAGDYSCPARYLAGSGVFRNHGSAAVGEISLSKAMEISCNTVFYQAADTFWRDGGGERSSETELDPIAQAATDLGLDTPTDVDLPGEAVGSIASPAAKYQIWQDRRETWCAAAELGYPELAEKDRDKARYFQKLDADNCERGDLWQQGDAINAAIGQGGTATSVLGLATAYAALLGDGRIRTPKVGRAVIDPNGEVSSVDPVVAPDRVVPPEVTRFLQKSLSRVTKSGTAKVAFAGFPLDRYPVAGKTGTAQVDDRVATSWFASAAPANDPQYVVVVSVPEGGDGGSVAAPIARSIYEVIFGLNGNNGLPSGGPSYEIPRVKIEQP